MGVRIDRWVRKGKSRLLPRRRLQLVYSQRYPLELPGAAYDPHRGERILSFLDDAGLLDRRAVLAAPPATFRQLRRIHSDEYLDSLDDAERLTTVIGFQLTGEAAERVLSAQRAMVGGTILAARLAREATAPSTGGGIAVNLGGGLHHAFADKGERFCVYNDVAAAIAELRAPPTAGLGFGGRILVVDLDLHDGDGTRAIFAADPTVHTFSIHNLTTFVGEAAEATVIELPGSVEDGEYLETLRARLPPVVKAFRPEMVFYLAGCDPAAGDEIGNWKISAQGLLERDLFVHGCVRDLRVPLVVVLAGGYGPDAWRYSARFLSALLNGGKAVEPPSNEDLILSRYRRLAQELLPHELSGDPRDAPGSEGGDDWGLTADDILPATGGPGRPRRLLGFYSLQGLELALERAGVLDRVRALGFAEPTLELALDPANGDTVRLFGDRRKTELLIESRVLIDRWTAPGLSLLRLEWMLLQNPRARFTLQRPRLPGQRHPGLGMLQDMMALLVLACERLQLDGLLFVPAHFHTASRGRKHLRFLNPADKAFVRKLEEALAGLGLAEASAAVEEGRVVEAKTGAPLPWPVMPMVFPVTDRLRERVDGEKYQAEVEKAAADLAFRLVEKPASPA